jgi:hypothetical protein
MGPSEEGRAATRVFAGTTYLGTVFYLDMDPEEIAANAELWADAPRMLEVLRDLFASTIGDPMEDRHVVKKAYADAESLLEKHGG